MYTLILRGNDTNQLQYNYRRKAKIVRVHMIKTEFIFRDYFDRMYLTIYT